MPNFQNYFYGVVMMLITALSFAALFLPPPINFIFFLGITYGGNISFVIFYPKITRLVGNWRGNVIWIRVDVPEVANWKWPPFTFQLWYDLVPVSIEIQDAYGNFVEWLHLLPLKDPIRHPKYNDGRLIREVAFKSGEYSIRPERGITLSNSEIREATSWNKLILKKKGIAFFAMMVGEHKTVDWIDGKEIIPTAQELKLKGYDKMAAESERLTNEALEDGIELLNNVPIIRHYEGGGVAAIPVIKIMRASGCTKLEQEIANTHPIVQEPLVLNPRANGEAVKTPLRIIQVPRKKKQ